MCSEISVEGESSKGSSRECWSEIDIILIFLLHDYILFRRKPVNKNGKQKK